MKTCTCGMTFEAGFGYLAIGAEKLTRDEILNQETCLACAQYRVTPELKLSSTTAALNMQSRPAEDLKAIETAAKEAKLRKQQTFGKRLYGSKKPRKERSFMNFIPPPAKEFVAETIAEAEGGHGYHKKPVGRKRATVAKPERNPNAPKKFGDEGRKNTPVVSAKAAAKAAKAAKEAAKKARR